MTIPVEKSLQILNHGKITIKGEFMWGSNYTFLTDVEHEGESLMAVYKPTRGERPLWDFPAASLARREVAAFIVSEALGWKIVPPTAYRGNAPLGAGSLQMLIDYDPDYHYFNFKDEDLQRLRPVVIFDFLINNADRKGSHVLVDPENQLWLIDHGLCFHVEDKVRSVIWDFVGEPIPQDLCSDVMCLRNEITKVDSPPSELELMLKKYISDPEVKALACRADQVTLMGYFPAPDPVRRNYPWPQI
jgi:uncharacterized repeat protein (TIGR03843 family)